MDVFELLYYVTPVITLVAVIALFMSYKMQSLSKKFEDYKNDEFRQSIEKQISDLTKELTVSRDRFDSVNHLLNDAQNAYFDKGGSRYVSNSEMKRVNFFDNINAKVDGKIDDNLVFVLTPFNEKYEAQYCAIKKLVTEYGFECSKGDDSIVSTNILAHIAEQISKARLVIANISGRNPNVFYELGIAHALGKPVIIVSESLSDIPFDINSSRILAFEDEVDLSNKLRNWFVHTLAKA
ncbi:nucleoside 2-deoxyribosyltransferase [Ferrimonas balearica]|uniref:nucleoside 2-deoxyribosyltransferase n=1 Tax=Ferrimonas balearica TaxID=44012 RepID=UPI001C58065E|nr:nucleoside 2-deoxyribosyltransferase [Ferrimonas balearica]MBW3140931.1 nucleoside 2-deoxyribosyltransferase [Ferrimonas balearica]